MNLGRDRIWTPEIWTAIDEAVKSAVGRVRVAQKVFPTASMPSALAVPADQLDPETRGLIEGSTKPFIELSLSFPLTESQAQNEATELSGLKLARFWARAVALAEDALIFQGKDAPIPDGVNVSNLGSAETGLQGLARHVIAVGTSAPQYPENVFEAVAEGIAKLVDAAHPGPYALIMESSVFADLHRVQQVTRSGALITIADRVTALVPGGFYPTGTLLSKRGVAYAQDGPVRTGLLVSLGGDPTLIYVGVDATTAFTQSDPTGLLHFRVFERFQFTALDGSAFVRFEFR